MYWCTLKNQKTCNWLFPFMLSKQETMIDHSQKQETYNRLHANSDKKPRIKNRAYTEAELQPTRRIRWSIIRLEPKYNTLIDKPTKHIMIDREWENETHQFWRNTTRQRDIFDSRLDGEWNKDRFWRNNTRFWIGEWGKHYLSTLGFGESKNKTTV